MKKLVALLLACVMVVSMSAVVFAGESDPFADMEEITLIYNSTRNELGDGAQLAWLNSITEATNGKVKFDTYMSSSLITSPRDIPEGLSVGIADIGLLNVNNYPGVFPLNNNICSVPLSGIKNASRQEILDYLYGKYPELEAEFTAAGLKLIGWNIASATNLGVKIDKPYETIADVKNLKVTSTGDVAAEILAAAGLVPVTVAYPDIYQSLEKNVINGLMFTTAPVYDTSFYEHIDNWLVFGEDSGIMYTTVAVCMGLDKWNELPEAVQEVILASEHDRAAAELDAQLNEEKMLKEALESSGKNYMILSDEQIDEWRPFVQPTVDRILSEMEAKFPGFGAMYEDLLAFIASK